MMPGPETTARKAQWKAEYCSYMVRCLTGALGWKLSEAEKWAEDSADDAWDNDPTEDPEDSARAELEDMCDA